jgi:MFS family permease
VHERGRANGLVATGQALGPLLGTLGGGLLMAGYGWRPAFLLFGALSLVWLWPWHLATRGGTTAVGASATATVPYARLLRERSLWGTSLGHFCGNYAYYFTLTWLPLLLVREHGLGMAQMAMVGSCVYALQAVAAPATGWLCDHLMRRGHSPDRVLKGVMNLGLGGAAAAMAGCAFAGPQLSIALILMAGIFFGMQSAPLGAISQTIGGPQAAGQWMGVQNLCANFAGVLAPLVTGFVVESTGGFLWAFVIAAGVTLAGVFAFGVVVRRVEPANW